MTTTWLPSWTDGPVRQAILDFVAASSDETSSRYQLGTYGTAQKHLETLTGLKPA